MMKKPRLILAAMGATVALISAFQFVWVVSAFHREKEYLRDRLTLLLRETALGLQFDLDKGFPPIPPTPDSGRVQVEVYRDTLAHHEPATLVQVEVRKDSLSLGEKPPFPGHHHHRMDLDLPPLVLDTVLLAFRQTLAHTQIPVEVDLYQGYKPDSLALPHCMVTGPIPGRISGGAPIFAISKGNTLFLLGRILPQIGISILIVGILVLTLALLWWNLRAQIRITGQQRQFISNMSHELKTPIATVGVALEALQTFDAMGNPAKVQEYLAISRQELNRLNLMVDKILRLNLLESGGMAMQMGPVDMGSLAEEAVAVLRLSAEQRGGRLELVKRSGDLGVSGDRLHLLSVLFNLVDNALKYSPEAPEVRVSLDSNPSWVTLEVEDKGVGIPAEFQDKIFEKFFRVPEGDVHSVKGYGLGLSYVHEVARLHGGTISVKSQAGKGSRFTLQLPRKPHG